MVPLLLLTDPPYPFTCCSSKPCGGENGPANGGGVIRVNGPAEKVGGGGSSCCGWTHARCPLVRASVHTCQYSVQTFVNAGKWYRPRHNRWDLLQTCFESVAWCVHTAVSRRRPAVINVNSFLFPHSAFLSQTPSVSLVFSHTWRGKKAVSLCVPLPLALRLPPPVWLFFFFFHALSATDRLFKCHPC